MTTNINSVPTDASSSSEYSSSDSSSHLSGPSHELFGIVNELSEVAISNANRNSLKLNSGKRKIGLSSNNSSKTKNAKHSTMFSRKQCLRMNVPNNANRKSKKKVPKTKKTIPFVEEASSSQFNTSSTSTDNFVQIKAKKRKMLPHKKLKSQTEDNGNVKSMPENTRQQFEEELKCTICSELFINAVTLNCTHSFCLYCISTWRKEQTTCPICRQKISNQTSTLVLDNCIGKLLETSNEDIRKHREEIIDYRNKNKVPVPANVGNNNAYMTPINVNSSDEYDFDDDYDDDTDDDYGWVFEEEDGEAGYGEEEHYDVNFGYDYDETGDDYEDGDF